VKAIGIILAGGNSKRMRQLSNKRAIAAMPVAGGYRAIDYALSSMADSGIKTVAVLTQFNSRSLNRHLSSSKWWDFGRKQGGLYVFNPTITPTRSDWYRGTADALYRNLDYLRESHEPYVVIAGGDCIYKLDYNKVLQYHIDHQADITVVTTTMPPGDDPERFGFVKVDSEKRIIGFEEKPVETELGEISCGIYVIRRRHLIELLEKCEQEDQFDFVQDILVRYKSVRRIMSYHLEEYWRNIASVEAYYQANMEFLNKEVREYFAADPQVMTKVEDLPPAKYNENCSVTNSLVADGCIINGRVENSLLFKDVYVGNNCTIRNSIVLNNVYIGDNTILENCIVESNGVLGAGENYIGTPEDLKIVIEKNDRFAG